MRAERLDYIQRMGIYKLLAIRQLVAVFILHESETDRREPQAQEN
jgi:hypothetical protein